MLGYVLDRFPTRTETFVQREIEGLAALGHRPKLWALRAAPGADSWNRCGATDAEAAAVAPKELSVLPSPFSFRTASARIAAFASSPARFLDAGMALITGASREPRTFLPALVRADAAYPLARALRREGVTHLHAHFGFVPSTVAWLASRLSGVPYSVSVHAWDVFANRSMIPEKLLAARRVVTCTRYARRFLLERYPSLRPERIVCVHHGLDLERWAALPMPAGDGTRVLAVGRLVPKKGFGVLLRAFARARASFAKQGRKMSLTLVGDGPERPRLETLARALGLGESLVLTGALSPPDVRREMARAHMLVAPSVRGARGDLDGLPNVILEAMASARPVVASRISGIPEAVVDGRTGLLSPAGDDEALARDIVRLARDRELALRGAAAGRRRVEERLSLKDSARAMARVFADMGAIDR